MPNNPNPQINPKHPPRFAPPARKTPLHYARYFGDLIKSAVIALFWMIVGCTILTLAVISLTALYWAARLILRALGV